MEKLDHQSSKSLERTRDPHGGADLDENSFGCVDIDLEFPGFVDGRVE